MIFKKRFSNQENLRLTLSPNFLHRTLSGDLCPCNRLLPYRNLKDSVWFCLLFKNHFHISCWNNYELFLWELCIGFLGSVLFFSNGTSPNLVLFFKGTARCGQWCHRNGGKRGPGEKLAQHGWEPKSKHADPTRLLSAPLREELFTGRMAPFSEKDCLNCLRKPSMQSTVF